MHNLSILLGAGKRPISNDVSQPLEKRMNICSVYIWPYLWSMGLDGFEMQCESVRHAVYKMWVPLENRRHCKNARTRDSETAGWVSECMLLGPGPIGQFTKTQLPRHPCRCRCGILFESLAFLKDRLQYDDNDSRRKRSKGCRIGGREGPSSRWPA